MTIARFSRMRDFGVFRDFTWPAELEDFKRFNLIYGWNGTGKSTLARILRCLELREPCHTGEVVVRCEGADIKGIEFSRATVQVRVFNRDFVDEAVFPTTGVARSIFVLGRENVEAQRSLENFKAQRTLAEATLNTCRVRRTEADTRLDSFCENQARLIKTALRSAGTHRYNNYNKSNFKTDIEALMSDDDFANSQLSEQARLSAENRMRGSPKPSLAAFVIAVPDLTAARRRVETLLGRSVVAETIDSLRSDQQVEAWVREGLTLLQYRGRGNCLFCEQEMPTVRLEALERHFNDEYQKLVSDLEREEASIASSLQVLERARMPESAMIYEDFGEALHRGVQQVVDTVAGIRLELERLRLSLRTKRQQMFQAATLEEGRFFDLTGPINEINAAIDAHNERSQTFYAEVELARRTLAKHILAEAAVEYRCLKQALSDAEVAITPAFNEIQRLASEIRGLETSLILHRRPAEQLNEDLKKYLGHSELQLAVQETGYSITRNGQPATALSEGERTAIALLYFLKSLEDRDFDLRTGVIVLDDPVSSLDQSALFAAFGFLRVRTQAAGQLVLLTHSFMFFRLAREWFKNLRGPDKRLWKIYMLRCEVAHNGRSSVLADIDPLLLSYESEYQYLFCRMYEMATRAPYPSLEAYYMAPSIARRVLESFLAFKVPDLGGDSHLWERMKVIGFDEERLSRIYRFVQTHSHRDSAGESDEDLTILAESRSVLNDLLAFMRLGDNTHVTRLIAKLGTDADN